LKRSYLKICEPRRLNQEFDVFVYHNQINYPGKKFFFFSLTGIGLGLLYLMALSLLRGTYFGYLVCFGSFVFELDLGGL
jgi:hypothetical protein